MTPNDSRPISPDATAPHDPQTKQQAIPLRSLAPGHQGDHPRPTPLPGRLPHRTNLHSHITAGSPAEFELDEAPFSHGTQSDLLGATGEAKSTTTSDENPTEVPMTKKPPFLRSTPEFRSPSYGAVSLDSVSTETESQVGLSSAVSDEGFTFDHAEPNERPRRKSDALPGEVSYGRLSGRRSENLAGSTVVGGLEARFSMTEGAMPSDNIERRKSDADTTSDGMFEASDEADDDEDPPDNSPYPQVRASVAPVDNTALSINTPRMWTLSILFSIIGSSTNLFFSLRYPSVAITPVIALLLVHPLGLSWDYFLKRRHDPTETFIDGVRATQLASTPQSKSRAHRFRLWLAQGRWNEKEHSCVYVSSNVSFGFAFATDVIVEQTMFYKQDAGILYQLLLTLSTQILGYTFAGLTRRFLVRPSGMIWPSTLMSAAMFTTLHKEENKPANGWTITRWNFFFVVFTGGFFFYFLPGLLMPALSYFNVITWFAPDNVVVSNLFGVVSGLGLFPLTFDWAQIAYIGSPLLTPFWAAMNVVGGLVIVMWIVAPIAYYNNWLYSAFMPILSVIVFDNKGKMYDVSKILTKDFIFDREAYHSYSRVFLPITYVLSYGVQFAGLASLLTHTACWHGKDIWRQWKVSLEEAREESKPAYHPIANSVDGEDRGSGRSRGEMNTPVDRSNTGLDSLMSREDVHNRLMRRYKDAPMWWYLLTFISMTAIGIFVVE